MLKITVALVLVASVALAACGGGDERKASLGAGSGPGAAAPSQEATPSEAKSTVKFWTKSRLKAADDNELPLPVGPKASAAVKPPAPEGAPVKVPEAGPTAKEFQGTSTGADASDSAVGLAGEGGSGPSGTAGAQPSYGPSSFSDESVDPIRLHGKIFMDFGSGHYVCSGTLVNSQNKSTVVTAGHCVFGASGEGAATNIVFVPGYRNGNAPYGVWPAETATPTQGWVSQKNWNYDFAFISLYRDSLNRPLQDLIGAAGITFNYARDQDWGDYGYPAATPFDGSREWVCDSHTTGAVNGGTSGEPLISIDCNMTGGCSGGGWMITGVNGTQVGSVNSNRISSEPEVIRGPYFGDEAEALYAGQGDLTTSKGPTVTPPPAATPQPGATPAPAKKKCSKKKKKKRKC